MVGCWTIGPNTDAGNLKLARDLLAQAGWHYRDGALRDAQGNPMTIEVIDDQPGMDRIVLPYLQKLELLGIQTHFRELDTALYQKRLDEFQFDMTTQIYAPVSIPGVELLHRFGSAAASQVGSENYAGVKSKAVDALVHAVLQAQTMEQLQAALRALDRVLINLYLIVPEYYMPNARIGFKSTIGHPQVVPDSYNYEDWILDYWYVKAPGAQH